MLVSLCKLKIEIVDDKNSLDMNETKGEMKLRFLKSEKKSSLLFPTSKI